MPQLIQVEDDPVEAAAKKEKMKQQAMRDARIARDERNGKGYISKSVRFRETSDDENEYGEADDMEDEEFDSEDLCYDSEEEAEAERKDRIDQMKSR